MSEYVFIFALRLGFIDGSDRMIEQIADPRVNDGVLWFNKKDLEGRVQTTGYPLENLLFFTWLKEPPSA